MTPLLVAVIAVPTLSLAWMFLEAARAPLLDENERPIPDEPATRYWTDGRSLYEIADQRVVVNYGLTGGVIRSTVLRDSVTGDVARVDDLHLAALTEVRS